MPTQLDALFALIDNANSKDPVHEHGSGAEVPRALLYGRRMSARLDTLCPDAPPELRIAARAQHICRWQIPRDSYPAGRSGYLKWRRDLARHHALLTAELMQQLSLEAAGIERVQYLLQKKNLKHDADTQTLEDIACLVFLEHYFADFCDQHSDEKIISILAKTWRKMSSQGQAAALALHFNPAQQHLIDTAIAGS